MKQFFSIFFSSLILLSCNTIIPEGQSYPYAYLYDDLPFEMPQISKPVFPNNKLSVAEYGGKPDGITLNTDAFEAAMQALSDKGGGTLIVPKGMVYRSHCFSF